MQYQRSTTYKRKRVDVDGDNLLQFQKNTELLVMVNSKDKQIKELQVMVNSKDKQIKELQVKNLELHKSESEFKNLKLQLEDRKKRNSILVQRD